MQKRTTADSFHGKYIPEALTGCWLWGGHVARNGYARTKVSGRSVMAHRASYELFVGPIPEGLVLDHKCRNRCCVNPAHLEPVTSRENLIRGETLARSNAEKTHCKCGLEYTRVAYAKQRVCIPCRKEAKRRYLAKQRSK